MGEAGETMTYRVQRTDLEIAANLLTRAMMDYPAFTYVMPDSTDRENKLCHVLRFILNVGSYQGEVAAPTRNIEAVAVWLRSEDMRLSPGEALLAGFATLPFKVGLPTVKRLLGLAKTKRAQRTKILAGRYYVLDMLGVDPHLQSRGYGRFLIEEKLKAIDRERVQCYLETSDERNIGYYRRFGFELIHQHAIETLPVHCLLRKAPAVQSVRTAR
jgi:ribosomal protein S18 acetylase RimI-like enzyme